MKNATFKVGDTIVFDISPDHANIGQIIRFEDNGYIWIKEPCGRIRRRNLEHDRKDHSLVPLEDIRDSEFLKKYYKEIPIRDASLRNYPSIEAYETERR